MGLVNNPARATPILRAEDQLSNPANEVQYTISYGLFCEEGDKVLKSDMAYGYKLKGHNYLVFDKIQER